MERTPRPLLLAHRGFHRAQRENTMAAFDAALEAGADGIEFDVRAARERHLVVHHDPEVRVARGRLGLRRLSPASLPPWVPALDDVLDWARANPGAFLDVELKESGLADETVRRLRARGLLSRSVITSFLPTVVREVKRAGSRVPVGLISRRRDAGLVARAVEDRVRLLVLHRLVATRPRVQRARSAGIRVWAWGANDLRSARRLAGRGAEALITDRPDRLVPLKRYNRA